MTIVLGWHDGETAWLVGDSALTSVGGPARASARASPSITSGWERETVRVGFRIVEGIQKVARVNDSTIAGWSGPTDRVQRFLSAIELRLASGVPVVETVAHVASALGPYADLRPDEHFAVIIASRRDQTTHMVRFDTLEGFSELPKSEATGRIVSVIGSHPRGELDGVLANVCRESIYPGVTPMTQLVLASLRLRCHLQKDQFLDRGMGGACTGILLNGTGVHWQSDVHQIFVRDAIQACLTDPNERGDALIGSSSIVIRQSLALVFGESVRADDGEMIYKVLPPLFPVLYQEDVVEMCDVEIEKLQKYDKTKLPYYAVLDVKYGNVVLLDAQRLLGDELEARERIVDEAPNKYWPVAMDLAKREAHYHSVVIHPGESDLTKVV